MPSRAAQGLSRGTQQQEDNVARGDGIHFGTGEEPNDGIMSILAPDAPCLLNEPEGQHWWGWMQQQRPLALNVYRASPQRKPADLNWDAHAYSREIFKGLDFHHGKWGFYPTEILLLNELNLDYERGDSKNDGGAYDTNPNNWPSLYRKLADFLDGLLFYCKERAADRGFAARWWFPGWAPGHGEMNPEIAGIWVPVAKKYDAVCLHAYYDRTTITDTTVWYAETFPNTPLLLGEWNMSGLGGDWRSASNRQRKDILNIRVEEEGRVRARLKSIAEQLPKFYACYFIHRWAEDNSHEHDIPPYDQRMALWDGTTTIQEDDWLVPGAPPPVDQPPVIDDGNGQEEPMTANPWEFWTAQEIADATDSLLENVEEHWPATVEQLVHCGINRKTVQRGLIATIAVETGPKKERRFTPVREAYWLDDEHGFEWAEEYRRTHLPSSQYFPLYGRGKTQTTWKSGYEAMGPKIAALWGADPSDPTFDLIKNPDNLLQRDMSAAADAIFFRDKRALPTASYPEGYSLLNACDEKDAVWIRKLVQGGSDGLDHLRTVLDALDAASPDAAEPVPDAPTKPSYNPDFPSIVQNRSFDCSETSLLWEFRAHGRETTDVWLEGRMLADGIMTEEWGLMDATGHGLAAFGNHYYGGFTTPGYSFGEPAEDLGYRFQAFGTNDHPATFDEIAVAVGNGERGVMAGGRAWVHWVAIRRHNPTTDVLEIANSAEGYKGIYGTLTRDQFDALGWFSYVTVDVLDPTSSEAQEPHEEPTPAPDPMAQMQAKMDELMAARAEDVRQLEEARRNLGVATVDVAGAFAKAPPKLVADADLIDQKIAAIRKATKAKAVAPLLDAIADAAQDVRIVVNGDIVPALDALKRLAKQG